MKAKAGAEAQHLRNRQSEPQFDGVVACGDLALQPFQAGERVGSGPVLIGSPWGDQVGAAGPSVIVVAWWYDPHMPTPFGRSIRHRTRATDFLKTNAGISYCDDCVRERLEITRAHLTERDMHDVAIQAGFTRELGKCSVCGTQRVITKAT